MQTFGDGRGGEGGKQSIMGHSKTEQMMIRSNSHKDVTTPNTIKAFATNRRGSNCAATNEQSRGSGEIISILLCRKQRKMKIIP